MQTAIIQTINTTLLLVKRTVSTFYFTYIYIYILKPPSARNLWTFEEIQLYVACLNSICADRQRQRVRDRERQTTNQLTDQNPRTLWPSYIPPIKQPIANNNNNNNINQFKSKTL